MYKTHGWQMRGVTMSVPVWGEHRKEEMALFQAVMMLS